MHKAIPIAQVLPWEQSSYDFLQELSEYKTSPSPHLVGNLHYSLESAYDLSGQIIYPNLGHLILVGHVPS